MMEEMDSMRKSTSQMGSALGGITKQLEKSGLANMGPRGSTGNESMFNNSDSEGQENDD
jgi:hypothetical protein